MLSSLKHTFSRAADQILRGADRAHGVLLRALDRIDDAVRHLDWVINGNEANAPWTRNGHPAPRVPTLMEDFEAAICQIASTLYRAGQAAGRKLRRLFATDAGRDETKRDSFWPGLPRVQANPDGQEVPPRARRKYPPGAFHTAAPIRSPS